MSPLLVVALRGVYPACMELRFFNPWAETIVGRNRLPHWDQPGATYFLTFRLADSIPSKLLDQWRAERDLWMQCNPEPWTPEQEAQYHKKFSGALERCLDDGHGECELRRADVRSAVEGVFTKFDGDRYLHHGWVIMPNHAHLLFSMRSGVELSELLKAWKGASSRAAGVVLGRRMSDDAFWQRDYFDRLVRDTEHFCKCVRYIRNNPGFAKLRESEYTLYLHEELRDL